MISIDIISFAFTTVTGLKITTACQLIVELGLQIHYYGSHSIVRIAYMKRGPQALKDERKPKRQKLDDTSGSFFGQTIQYVTSIPRNIYQSAQTWLLGNTPLHDAVKLDDVELVQKLIEDGSDVNALNGLGLAPLHYAAILKAHGCLSALLEGGAENQATTFWEKSWKRAVKYILMAISLFITFPYTMYKSMFCELPDYGTCLSPPDFINLISDLIPQLNLTKLWISLFKWPSLEYLHYLEASCPSHYKLLQILSLIGVSAPLSMPILYTLVNNFFRESAREEMLDTWSDYNAWEIAARQHNWNALLELANYFPPTLRGCYDFGQDRIKKHDLEMQLTLNRVTDKINTMRVPEKKLDLSNDTTELLFRYSQLFPELQKLISQEVRIYPALMRRLGPQS